MNIDAKVILNLRAERAWSQEDLAHATNLNLRTIQRIEKSGTASLQSIRALAKAFGLDVQDLANKGQQVSPCPECRSEEVYRYKKPIDSNTIGGELLPKLATGRFSAAKILPVLCSGCGYVRFFAEDGARAKLEHSKDWQRV